MKQVYQVDDGIFAIMISVNVLFSAIWMSILLTLSKHSNRLDHQLKLDTQSLQRLINKTELQAPKASVIPELNHYIYIFAVAFGMTGISHYCADKLAPFIANHYPHLSKFSLTSEFFWVVISVTTLSLLLSTTRLRNLEHAGASKVASIMLYFLIANMGLQMDLAMIDDFPIYFLLGFIWLSIHIAFVVIAGLIMRAPIAYMALSSQCCIGGAASSPVVALAFHRSLAPVAILFSVFGYAWATYMAWLCAEMMRPISP
ncbi:DUF819 family protein [Shewanella maritima]|uniref:DUF819 family protein n=1 Tax=Shewanella maritima TaxID=2520507 RepID=A0A411PKV2_9GAMM|nr:DUF819 family protein [Shewanella maritima]